MEIDQKTIYAVLSGDIVNSSKLEKSLRERLILLMKQGSELLHATWPDAIPFPIDVFAGDSWQLLVVQPKFALRAAVFFRAFLIDATDKKADTRTVVSLGKIDFISRERISESDGEAFRNAGKLLREEAGKRKMKFVGPAESNADYWQCILALLDALMSKWSAKQARAVSGAIRGLSQKQIASLWTPPVSHPTISKILNQAEWPIIEQAILLFEDKAPP